jgi:hypothetical protein
MATFSPEASERLMQLRREPSVSEYVELLNDALSSKRSRVEELQSQINEARTSLERDERVLEELHAAQSESAQG